MGDQYNHDRSTCALCLAEDLEAANERIAELEQRLSGAIAALKSLQEVVPPRDWNAYAESVLRLDAVMAKGKER